MPTPRGAFCISYLNAFDGFTTIIRLIVLLTMILPVYVWGGREVS